MHNNTVQDLLGVAEAMLNGEIEYRRGNYEVAFAYLRRSVELDDALPYDEPWGWMQPTRHALGALLLEQGRVAEAEAAACRSPQYAPSPACGEGLGGGLALTLAG